MLSFESEKWIWYGGCHCLEAQENIHSYATIFELGMERMQESDDGWMFLAGV